MVWINHVEEPKHEFWFSALRRLDSVTCLAAGNAMEALKTLFKQPYWVIALVAGVVLVGLTCITLDKDNHWTTHAPGTLWLAIVGASLLALSSGSFVITLLTKNQPGAKDLDGLDAKRVRECDGALCTNVNGCEIRVVNGRIEEYQQAVGAAIVLPCNEYFDDRCVGDTRSSLGAYANRMFEGKLTELSTFIGAECRKKLGKGDEQQKTDEERAESFGVGRCLLLTRPLGSAATIALVSTTTQRAGEGLAARISYMFEGMRELFTHLADARINEVAMPILGSGHGQIDPPLAFVGLLLAVAEAARYGQGGQRLKRVTIVVFQKSTDSPPQVDKVVVRRALALIGSRV